MNQETQSNLLSLPEGILDEVLWETFQQSSFRDWLKLRQVCSLVQANVDRLIYTRDPLDDMDGSLALHIPTWHPVSTASIPNDALIQYCAKRALTPSHIPDPLDDYTRRVAAALMPAIRTKADIEGRPLPTLAELLPAFYDYMIWPGRYDGHRRWNRRDHNEHLPISIASCAALFNLREFTIQTLEVHKEREPDDFAWRFDNVMLNAALGGHIALMKEIHALGVKPQRNFDPDTLACAVWAGSEECVKYLLETDYKPNQQESPWPAYHSALLWAAKAGRESIMDMLFAAWDGDLANSNDNARYQRTQVWAKMLLKAIRHDRLSIVRRALQEGPKEIVQTVGYSEDFGEMTCLPLEVAAEFGRVEVLRLLIDHGAVIRPMIGFDEVVYRAAKHGHVEAVKVLLDLGVEPDWAQTMSASPISWVQAAAATGEDRVVSLFIERGFDAKENGVQAAQIAAMNGYATVVKVLMGAGVDAERIKPAAKEHGQQHVLIAIEEMQTGTGVAMP